MLARPNTPLYDTLEAGRPFSIRSYEYELVSACDAEVLFVWVGDSTGLPLHFFRFFLPSGHQGVYLLLRHLRLSYLHLRHYQIVCERCKLCVEEVGPASCIKQTERRPKSTMSPLSRQRMPYWRQLRLLVTYSTIRPTAAKDFVDATICPTAVEDFMCRSFNL